MTRHIPWGDDTGTIACPVCATAFEPSGRRRYCSDACRRIAWKRQHQTPTVPTVVPPRNQPRRPITVYECAACGTRALGEQRCDECGVFMVRIGIGGLCPHCDEPVAIDDIVDLPHDTRPASPNATPRT